MKSQTLSEPFGMGVLAMVVLLTASGWIYGIVAERRAQDVMREIFSQPTPEYGPAFAAGYEPDESEQPPELASGK
jgi:hypothetical protein